MDSMSDYLDMSEYPKDSKYHNGKNRKVIGKFKVEVSNDFISEFIGIRSKTYSFIKNNDEISKKLKGVSKPDKRGWVYLQALDKILETIFEGVTERI